MLRTDGGRNGRLSARRLFATLDRDGDGALSMEEWSHALRTTGKLGARGGSSSGRVGGLGGQASATVSEATIWRLFDLVDANGDLWIDEDEFVAFLGTDSAEPSSSRSRSRSRPSSRASSRPRSRSSPRQRRAASVTPRSRRTFFDAEIEGIERGRGWTPPPSPRSPAGRGLSPARPRRASSSRRFRSRGTEGPRGSAGGDGTLPFITLVGKIKSELGLEQSLRPREAVLRGCEVRRHDIAAII